MARGISRQSKRLDWQSAVPELVPGPEFCPSAVDEYTHMFALKKKAPEPVLSSVRKHLLYFGWKIDCLVDKGVTRLRYSSPHGEYFYSLPQACVKFGHVRQASGPDSPVLNKKMAIIIGRQNFNLGSSEISPTSPLSEAVVEPEYCPEAVNDYYLHSSGSEWKSRALKAKKHLSAIGWSFYYTLKGDGKRELRYRSPGGKLFFSLLTACKWCVEARALTSNDLIGKIGNTNESHSPVVNDVFLNPPNESSVRVPPVETEVCKKPIILKKKKKRNGHDESNCIEGPQFSKRGKKSKLKTHANADASKRVRKMAVSVSPYHQTARTVLSWLIDNDVVLPQARVEYRGKSGSVMAEGRIAREGIQCSCCGVIFTLTKFEAHAGSTNHRPAANIFVEDGRSLLECQSQLKQRKSDVRPTSHPCVTNGRRKTNISTAGDLINDEICSICRYGGELVLCDQCPSSFHTQCLGLKEVPDGDWFCPSCCCQICRMGRFDGKNGQVTDCSVLTCCQCERRYHAECLRNNRNTKRYPEGYWFCQDACERIFCYLHKILGKPVPVGTGDLTWTLLKYIKSDTRDQYASNGYDLTECYGKLNVALGVMHECFEPVKDPGTGRDLVEDVIFGKWSETNRANFRGFYTAVLEKNDEMISAATVRIYGKSVAEVPLIATRFQYRRLGMCRILMNELEKKLTESGVERLVLPAVPSLLDTWTNSFGFSVMYELERLKFLDCTFLDFQGTVICQKVLTSNSSSVSSCQSTEKQTNETDNVELDENSALSEFFQGEQLVEETEFIEQEAPWWIDELLLSPECRAFKTKTPTECLPRNNDDRETENNSKGSIVKFYTRRRVSACV